jgi:hypothetical protein
VLAAKLRSKADASTDTQPRDGRGRLGDQTI